mgnify:CR=1 FL=1
MDDSDIMTGILSIASLGVTLIAIVIEVYRVLLISLLSLFLATYFLYNTYDKINNNTEEIKKLNEKLKIHRDVIDIKADIKNLNKKVFEK